VAVAVAGIGAGLANVLRSKGLQAAAAWAQLVSIPLAILPLIGPVLRWWRHPAAPAATISSPDQVDQAQRALAAMVLIQWREEIRIRQLDDPAPLAVRWHLTGLDVMDDASQVARPAILPGLLGRGRLRFSGRADRIDEMAKEFRHLMRRRLAILGEPGMGKTTLAVLLLKALLEDPQPGDPVPVLLTMSGWDPGTEPLRQWLARRLGEDYPALRAAVYGPNASRALVTERRILPILDGLDELPPQTRPKVLDALSTSMINADTLILTCRTTEFEKAVSAPGGGVLTGGAVIEPSLLAADAAAYLTNCVRRRRPQARQQPGPAGGWPGLLSTLTTRPHSPIARALTTPLALWLVRKVYVDTGRDPAELLDMTRFPTGAKITEHLLGHLTQAVITANLAEPTGASDHPFRPRHAWEPNDTIRWLGFLAHHLDATRRNDLSWWELRDAAPSPLVGLSVGLAAGAVGGVLGGLGAAGHTGGFAVALLAGLAVGLTIRLMYGLAGGLPGGLAAGVMGGLIGGVLGGLLGNLAGGVVDGIAVGLWVGAIGGVAGGFAGGLAGGFAGGLLGAFEGGVAGGVVDGLAVGVAVGVAVTFAGRRTPAQRPDWSLYGILFGLAVGLAGAVIAWLTAGAVAGIVFGVGGGLVGGLAGGLGGVRADLTTAADPGAVLVRDRRTFQMVGIIAWVVAGLIVGLVTGLARGVAGGLGAGVDAGLGLGLGAALAAAFVQAAWGAFTIARCWLALWRRLPWRLVGFLDDAHRLGLLRQVGPAYQFRHARLQDHLAEVYRQRACRPANGDQGRTATHNRRSTRQDP
jgi:NACHT domain